MKIIKINHKSNKNLAIVFFHGMGGSAGEFINFVDDFKNYASLFFYDISKNVAHKKSIFHNEINAVKGSSNLLTKFSKVIFVSHSLGTYLAYVISSKLRKKNKNIHNLFISPAWLINFNLIDQTIYELDYLKISLDQLNFYKSEIIKNQDKAIRNFVLHKEDHVVIGDKDKMPYKDIKNKRKININAEHNLHIDNYNFMKKLLNDLISVN